MQIQEIQSWQEIPQEVPKRSYRETALLLIEMREVLGQSIAHPKYYTEKWWCRSIHRAGYSPTFELGLWFFDSLIAVNEILRQEAEENIPRPYKEKMGSNRYGAFTLASLTADCYVYPGTTLYHWRVYCEFWTEKEHEYTTGIRDVTAMLDDEWPMICRELGILPSSR